MHFFLTHVGRCGLVFLLDASLVTGCILFLITLVGVPRLLVGCRHGHWMHVFLNHVGRYGHVFLLDAGLVIGYIFS